MRTRNSCLFRKVVVVVTFFLVPLLIAFPAASAKSSRHGSGGGGNMNSNGQGGNTSSSDSAGSAASSDSSGSAGSAGSSDSSGDDGNVGNAGSSDNSGDDGNPQGPGDTGNVNNPGDDGKPQGSEGSEGSTEEDSEQPAWAGKDGDHSLKPGGGNKGSTTKKGDEYGDLVVMERNDDGTLVMHEVGDMSYPATILSDGTTFVLSEDAEPPADLVQEVELGRLNVTRAPDKVLDHRLTEALGKLDGLSITIENFSAMTDLSGRLLTAPDTAIDSPLENLAIYQAILEGYVDANTDITITAGDYSFTISSAVVPQLAASTLAAAADKTSILNVDKVVYMSTFLDVEDKLEKIVTDYDNWYSPGIYDVQVSVLNLDDMAWSSVSLLNAVEFSTINPIVDNMSGIDYFTKAADDSLQVLEYVHDNTFE